jgi:hypothetical protein
MSALDANEIVRTSGLEKLRESIALGAYPITRTLSEGHVAQLDDEDAAPPMASVRAGKKPAKPDGRRLGTAVHNLELWANRSAGRGGALG